MSTPHLDTTIPSRPTSRASRGKRAGRDGALSPARLERMHAIMHRHVERGWVPGLVTVVSRHGEDHLDAMGTLAFGSRFPMSHDTLFRLASSTKPITAVAAMILVEECRLRLDAPVDDWLPELANRRVLRTIESPLDDTIPANRPITLRDLLTFRAGYGEVMFLAPGSPIQKAMAEARLPLTEWLFDGTPDELMKRLGALPLAHQPGERWLYHMGAEIVGVLVARVAGKSLGSFLQERLFEPLGMKDTGFTVPEAKMDRFSTCYRRDASTGHIVIHDDTRSGLFARPRAFESGAGGLVSTADDLLAFGRMMLNGGALGRERILSRPSIELMTADHLTPEQKAASPFFLGFWDVRGWGLGLSVVTQRSEIGRGPGCFGWDGTFGTSWYVDPSEDMIGILMSQRVPDSFQMPASVLDFWTAAYQCIDD